MSFPCRLALIALALVGCGEPPATTRVEALVPRFGGPIALGRSEGWTNDACGECHAEERAAFARSGHARGLESPRFAAEWSGERLRFCSDCHAPLGPPGSVGAQQAVGCASCHVRGGVVLAFGSASTGRAPHATREARGDPDRLLCAPCHDFSFPDARQAPHSAFDPEDALQSTWREWEGSDAAPRGEGCIDCHMRGRDHGLALRRDPLAPVLRVSHRWRAGGVVELRLESTQAVGHAIPTGDVFRMLAVELREPGASTILATSRLRRELAGHRHVDGVVRIREVRDRRVPPPGRGPVITRLRVGGEPRALEVVVTLHRGAGSLSGRAGAPDDLGRELYRDVLPTP